MLLCPGSHKPIDFIDLNLHQNDKPQQRRLLMNDNDDLYSNWNQQLFMYTFYCQHCHEIKNQYSLQFGCEKCEFYICYSCLRKYKNSLIITFKQLKKSSNMKGTNNSLSGTNS